MFGLRHFKTLDLDLSCSVAFLQIASSQPKIISNQSANKRDSQPFGSTPHRRHVHKIGIEEFNVLLALVVRTATTKSAILFKNGRQAPSLDLAKACNDKS